MKLLSKGIFTSKYVLVLFVLSNSLVNGQTSALFNEENGCLHGEYKSFHDNGTLKTEGNFFFNRRIGDWKIYDAMGEVITQRHYDSLGVPQVVKPLASNTISQQEENKQSYKLERDSLGVYKFQHIYEKNIVWTKRVWSFLPQKYNTALYDFNWFGLLNGVTAERTFHVYKNDEFSEFYEHDDHIELTNMQLIGIAVKKDYFYESISNKMDARVLGIILFAEDTLKNEVQEFILYYPIGLRNVLVKKDLQHEDPNIKNLDDLFFFNAYSEIIYQELYLNTNRIVFNPKNEKEYVDFSKRIKSEIIQVEHDEWIKM
jgi:hypothetical protein